MKQKELQKVLEKHRLWLGDCGGACADLSFSDLINAKLNGANLRGAYLSYADLSGADLSGAKLNGANLIGARLNGANFSDADLSDADLSYAKLIGAYLINADLSYAKLIGADLRGADLNGAKLRGANLSDANLSYAKLIGANLNGIMYNESTAFFALQCPEEGSFVGWKKCKNDVLVKLSIPEDAKRSSATTRKCRASKAVVLEVIGAEKGISKHDSTFVYEVGKEMIPDSFDEDRWSECSNGVSFFMTRKEAENY